MVRITQRLTLSAGLIVATLTPVLVQAQAEVGSGGHSGALRCERASAAASALAKTYQSRATASEEALGRIHDRLVNIIGRADARGYNVSRLQADQAELERRTAAVTSSYAAVVTAINSSQPMCGAEGSLNPAREALAKVRDQISDLKTWQASRLQTDMTALKNAERK